MTPLQTKLTAALNDLISADPEADNSAIVKSLWANHRALMNGLASELAHLQLVKIRAKSDADLPAARENEQMVFPSMKVLGKPLTLAHGKTVKFGDATLKKLRSALAQVRRTDSPAARRLAVIIAQMEPVAKLTRGLTVKRFYELKAAEQPASRTVGS